ncbi:MAG: GH1 family beta-glucosidase [bacterium]|nr:GH1 family beta-glucosidase [bacterium]
MFYQFPKDFVWGCATASYQIEGAFDEDGKGPSIWDVFTHIPGNIVDGSNGDIACDHYHRYAEDIELMKVLRLKAYRFSISWPRVFPEGKGNINRKGIDFYKKLVDILNSAGITPFATIYHWDLPQALEENGGWGNLDTSKYFADYSYTLFKELGESIPFWITLNEPAVFTYLGYGMGIHAPGKKDFSLAVKATYSALLAHGLTVEAYRDLGVRGQIGITLNLTPMHPASNREEDVLSARKMDLMWNRWFLDPVLKGSFPQEFVELLDKNVIPFEVDPEHMKKISLKIDFLGVNYYTRNIITYDPNIPITNARGIEPTTNKTEMGWEIYPEGLYELLASIKKDYGNIPLYITENGAAFRDELINDRVDDPKREDYLRRHFYQAYNAIKDGVNLKGYFVWSLLDNFEWAYGYTKRFGIIYVDYPTQRRIIKRSGYYYRRVIEENGVEL